MSQFVRSRLPRTWKAILWGDRERWGLSPDIGDPDWSNWLSNLTDFYDDNQRNGIGLRVNEAGYRIMREVNIDGKDILEIGPGDIRHTSHWVGKPSSIQLVDVNGEMLKRGAESLRKLQLEVHLNNVHRSSFELPLSENSVDVAVSFYSLEHIAQLPGYVKELHRVLRPEGVLVGAIPTEGSLAWGVGRMLTSRRWLKKYTSINPDKIICWEHPNFGDDIIRLLDAEFLRVSVSTWPFPRAPLDLNLIIKFVYRKTDSVTKIP